MTRPTPAQIAVAEAGDYPETDFVPKLVKLRPHPAEQRYLDQAAWHRAHAELLLDHMEEQLREFGKIPAIPLDAMDRLQRILMAAHVDNQLRVSRVSERALLEVEQ